MEQLVRRSTLRATFSTNFLMLAPARDDNGAGQLELVALGLRDILVQFVEHRLDVIQRRSRWELDRRERRLHIVEGLLKAIDHIDEVIETIRRSQRVETARRNLMRKFKLTEVQATAILDMQLRRLAAMERKKLQDEAEELEKRIAYLKKLLGSQKMQLEVIVEETNDIREKYARPRCTAIVDAAPDEKGGVVTATELATPEEPQMVVVTTAGVSRCNASSFRDRSKSGTTKRRTTANRIVFSAEPTDTIILAADDGTAWVASVGWAPEKEDRMTKATIVYGAVLDKEKALVLGTSAGKVKRIDMADVLAQPVRLWNEVIGLSDGDRVVFAGQAGADDHVVFVKQKKAIRFKAEEVSTQATPSATGVVGTKTDKDDQVVCGGVVSGVRGRYLFIVSDDYIKKVPVNALPVQGRGGQGVAVAARKRWVVAATVGQAEKWVDVLDAMDGDLANRQRLTVRAVTTDTGRTRRGKKLSLEDPAAEIVLF
jgi:DNA gyrase subunit A